VKAGAPHIARDPEIARFLEGVYSACNTLGRLRRDPLARVRPFSDPADREIAAIVCSMLAFGSVDLIMRACSRALAPLGDRPAASLSRMGEAELGEAWGSFQYRFCFARDLIAVMRAIKRARESYGSLEDLFLRGDPGGPDVVGALGAFVRAMKDLGREGGRTFREGLMPDPARGSACKRPFLALRWLSRKDRVDPGGWSRVHPSRLVVPLDLHMSRVCYGRLGFMSSRYANLRNALEATAAFRLYAPDDPVKFDFALTRPGIDPAPGDERFGCA
jgi:uncharacterized protein (TIGR02757 family)